MPGYIIQSIQDKIILLMVDFFAIFVNRLGHVAELSVKILI